MAEETENGGLLFGIRLDNSELAKDVELSNKLFESIAKSAEETGKVIQHWFSDMQVVPKIDTGKFKKDLDQVQSAMAESSTKGGQGYNKAFADLYVAAGNAGAKVRDESRQTVTSVTDDLGKLNSGFNAITGLASKMFLGVSAMNIGMQVYQTRSYFQDAESSMKVFLGDAEKGSKFINELKDYAFYNMFEFKDLVGASKQLIAYGVEAKDVTGILDKLSNIATGTGASLNDMVAMYNEAKSVGKVDSQGLESWAARGVLVKKTLEEMGEAGSGTTITFEQLDKALDKVTGEGGMFHNLMAEQLNNLSASYAQLQDNMTAMYEEIGEKAEPFMKGAIDLAGTLVENYQDIASAIVEVAKVYGAFKLVDMADVQGLMNEIQAQQQQADAESILVETYKEHSEELEKMLTAEQAHALEMSDLEENTAEYAKCIQDMISAEAERTESALESVGTELDAEEARKSKLDELKATTEEQIATYQKSGDTKKVEALQTRLETVQEAQNASAKKISELQTKKTLAAIDAETAARNREKLATMQSTAAIQTHSKAMMMMQKVSGALNNGLTKLGKLLDGMGLTNPYALALAGAIALIDAIKAICTAETEWEQLSNKVEESKAEAYKSAMSEIRERGVTEEFEKVEELAKKAFASQKNGNELTEDVQNYKDALNGLIEKYPVVQTMMQDASKDAGSEAGMLDILSGAYDAVTESIYAKNKAAENEKLIDENEKSIEEENAAALKEFKAALEDMDFDKDAVEAMGEQYRQALMKGLKIEEMPQEIQRVFKEYKGTGEKVVDFFGFGAFMNRTNEKGYWASIQQSILNDFGAADDGYARFNTKLEANQRARERQAASIRKVNDELKEEAENIKKRNEEENQSKLDDYKFSPLLKELKEKQQAAKEQLESLTVQTLGFEEMTEEEVALATSTINNYRDEYDSITNQIAIITKRLYGDKNAAKQAYKQQLDAYKSFAAQYTAIAIKQQNELKRIADERKKYDANQESLDLQEKIANDTATDAIDMLFAKFYNMTGSVAERVKKVFTDALNTPIDDAKKRLMEVVAQQERIKDAEAKGGSIATKEQQAALAAEAAGLQQVINLAEQANKERVAALERVAAIEKDLNEKFISSEGKKQKSITDTYNAQRAELKSMLELGQITQAKYDELTSKLNVNEMTERNDAYIDAYGNYYQKREQLAREWEKKLADIPLEYRGQAEKRMKEEMSELDFSQFQKKVNWDAVFGDLGNQTSRQLKSSLDALQKAFTEDKGKMTVEQIKLVQETMAKLKSEIDVRNPFTAIFDGIGKIKENREELPLLLEEQRVAVENLTIAQDEYDAALQSQLDAEKQYKLAPTIANENKLKRSREWVASATMKCTKALKELDDANDKVQKNEQETADAQKGIEDGFADVKKTVDKLGNAFKELGSAIGGSGEEALNTVGTILTATMSAIDNIVTFTTTSIEGIKTATSAATVALKTIESASVILAIIGAVIQLGTAIASLVSKKDPVDEMRDSLHEFNLELEKTKKLAAQEVSFKAFDTIFGEDKWGKMTNHIRIGMEALDEFNKVQQDIIAKAQTMTGKKEGFGTKGILTATGAMTGDPVTAAVQSLFGGNKSYATAAGQYSNISDTVANMKVKVQHKTWFRSEKATTLKDALPSLFNAEGELDYDALHKFVESNNEAFQDLSQSNQDYLKKMDESWQEYNESVQEVRDTFTDFFGSVGAEIQDIWVDAFRSGEYALEDFQKSWDNAIENMISSLAYSVSLGKILSDAEKELDKIDFFKDPTANLERAVEIIEDAEETANNEGRDLFNSVLEKFKEKGYFKEDETESRNAVTGGIANVSQDTAEEMNGRLTQIQSHTFSINESVKQLTDFSSRQLIVLQAIHVDTSALVTTTKSMKATLDDITIKGVKLKA